MRTKVSLLDRIHYRLTIKNRTEDYYRLQYEHLFSRHFSRKDGYFKIGPLTLPRLSNSEYPTREDAYYAMEIGDILYPGLFDTYKYVDEGPYEWEDISVNPGDIVFDCGANLGIFSLYAAYRGADVYAFEPIAEARDWIHKGIELNPRFSSRITVIPYGISDTNSTAKFTVLDDTLIGSSMVLTQPGRTVTAKTVTIDSFCHNHNIIPTFIKADIEGAERRMLAGAVKTLTESAPKLALCTYHLPDDKKVMTNLILSANKNYKIIDKWKKIYCKI